MLTKKSRIYRSLTITGIVMLSLLMIASLSVYLLPHFGWRVDGLRSGSMEPQLKAGDLVVTRPVKPEAVAVGDIITFHYSGEVESLVSHRVIGIQEKSPLSFKTKGDANDSPDPFITPARELVGRVSFHFPLLGYAVLSLKTASGLLIALVMPGLVITRACLSSIHRELVKKKRNALGQRDNEEETQV